MTDVCQDIKRVSDALMVFFLEGIAPLLHLVIQMTRVTNKNIFFRAIPSIMALAKCKNFVYVCLDGGLRSMKQMIVS